MEGFDGDISKKLDKNIRKLTKELDKKEKKRFKTKKFLINDNKILFLFKMLENGGNT